MHPLAGVSRVLPSLPQTIVEAVRGDQEKPTPHGHAQRILLE